MFLARRSLARQIRTLTPFPFLAGPENTAPSRLSKPANSVIATADSGQSNSERARWAPGPQSPPPQQQVSLPTWMMEVPLAPSSAPASRALCPETVWRQVRWPASPPGLLVRAACPPHAQPLAPGEEPLPVALACQPDASWAPRAHSARCVSNWLRQLNQRAELGDSPLSLLSELVLRTRPLAAPPTPAPGALFGQDLLVVGRLVHRLAGDEMADLLNRINDDKQRLAFVREVVQVSCPLSLSLSLHPASQRLSRALGMSQRGCCNCARYKMEHVQRRMSNGSR